MSAFETFLTLFQGMSMILSIALSPWTTLKIDIPTVDDPKENMDGIAAVHAERQEALLYEMDEALESHLLNGDYRQLVAIHQEYDQLEHMVYFTVPPEPQTYIHNANQTYIMAAFPNEEELEGIEEWELLDNLNNMYEPVVKEKQRQIEEISNYQPDR